MSDTTNLFDELVDTTYPAPDLDGPEPVITTTTDEKDEKDEKAEKAEESREWPKYVLEGDPLWTPVGPPVGYLGVAEFAAHLSAEGARRALTADPTMDIGVAVSANHVIPQNVYQASDAKRHQIPSIIVRTVTSETNEAGEVTGSTTNDRRYWPVDAATEAFFTRPTRGEGSGAALTADDVQGRVLRAGKARAKHAALTKRLAAVTTQLAKQNGVVAKHERLLAEVGRSWDDAITAYDAWLATQEDGKTIEDDTADENGTE